MVEAVAVQYRTHPIHGAENERLVVAVFDELRVTQPDGLRYAAFRLGDADAFLHVALLDDPAQNPLSGLRSFQAFQRHLGVRCATAPNAERGRLIASYRLLT